MRSILIIPIIIISLNASAQSEISSDSTLRKVSHNCFQTEVLIIVDARRFPCDSLSQIKEQDIEDLRILRGTEATALYGSSAKHGVLIFTTKKYAALLRKAEESEKTKEP